jgi:IS605 OrfB family transposase
MYERARNRRTDFCHQTAHTLTTDHGLVVVEDLRVKNMTRSGRRTVEKPGTNVRQKAGLNRSILDKSWGRLRTTLEWHGRKNGCKVVAVPAPYRSQTCSSCWWVASESRESQAAFCCVACGFQANADVNPAKNILALGLRVSGRGGLAVGPPMKRQPLAEGWPMPLPEQESPWFAMGRMSKNAALIEGRVGRQEASCDALCDALRDAWCAN